MALIRIEGFDSWGATGGVTAVVNGNLVDSSSSLINLNVSTNTRFGYGRAMGCIGSNFRYRNVIANRIRVFQGAAIFRGTSDGTATIFEVYDGVTMQCHLDWDSTLKQISIYRGSGTTNLIAQSAPDVTPAFNNWFYLEWSPLVDPVAGTVDVRVDGISVISATGLNTRASATSRITLTDLRAAQNRILVDDYYVFDDQGSANNDFNGDSRVYTLYPDTDDVVEFTPNVGSVNADNVDDLAGIDNNDTHNFSSVVGEKDSFNIEQIPTDAVVSAIETRIVASKDDTLTRTLRAFLERDSNVANETTRTLGTSYVLWAEGHEDDPTDSSPLTTAKVNAFHLGYEIVS